MKRSREFLAVIAALVQPALGAPPTYVDVTEAAGTAFVGSYGPTFASLTDSVDRMLQRNLGNGVAVGDVEGDGDLDVYLLANLGLPNVLLRNELDRGIKRFVDATEQTGLGDVGLSRVAQFADLDGDGDMDLVLVNDDDGTGDYPPSRIFRNDGAGAFSAVADAGFAPDGYFRMGLAIDDYDQDGLLDIFVTIWAKAGTSGTAEYAGSNRLYRNLGGLQFQDVTDGLGLDLSVDGFTPIFHDFDRDGFPDLFVAIDHSADAYYRNRNGSFALETAAAGLAHAGNDMGADLGDVDGDAQPDLYVTNITDPLEDFGTGQGNALHINRFDSFGSPKFTDEAYARAVEDTYWGWGVQMTDGDNDGDLDLVAVTGFDEWVAAQGGAASPVLATPSVLFVNDGSGHFSRTASPGALDRPDDSRGLVAFDYDRDGDEDLLVTNVDQPARLFENVTASRGHWLGVRLRQAAGLNNDGLGAFVVATAGGRSQRQDLFAGGSYLAGTPLELHFGLGAAAVVDELAVFWTDGTQSSYFDVQADRLVRVVQGQADADLDGVADSKDCRPADATAWSLPGPAADLRLTLDGGGIVVQGSTPDAPGSTETTFDLIQAADAPFAAGGTCVFSGRASPEGLAPLPPGEAYYLLRSRNRCGAHAGHATAGPRALPACGSRASGSLAR